MNTLGLGDGFKKQDGRLNSYLKGAHFIGLKIVSGEPDYSIVDYAFKQESDFSAQTASTSPEATTTAISPSVILDNAPNDELITVCINAIQESCPNGGINGYDSLRPLFRQLKTNEVDGAAERFITNFNTALGIAKNSNVAWADTVGWLRELADGQVPF